jgi:proteasome lid subunit RPN8/RPN11
MLTMLRTLHDEVIAHCRRAYPKEACGLLAGKDGVVAQVYPMTNVEDSPIGYAMDPKEQLAIEKQMRQRGQRMIGIYHSHTASDAYPSSVDVSLAISPDVSYVLVSLKDRSRPDVKSYRIEATQVTPEDVKVTTDDAV